MKESSHGLQVAFVVEGLLWKTGVHAHIHAEQADVRAAFATSTVDSGIRDTKASLGFLNVRTRSHSLRGGQRHRDFAVDERFEGIPYLKTFVC